MCGNVVRSTKDVHHVDRAGNLGDGSIHSFAENLRHLRIVHRHWYDLVTRVLHVLRNVECGSARLLDLDAEHGDATRRLEHAPDTAHVLDEMPAPVFRLRDSSFAHVLPLMRAAPSHVMHVSSSIPALSLDNSSRLPCDDGDV